MEFDFLGRLGHLGSEANKDFFSYNIAFTLKTVQSQKCIQKRRNGLLVEQDFCFWAFWAARARTEKNWAHYKQLLRAFFMFSCEKEKSYISWNITNFSKIAKKFRQTYSFWHYLLLANFAYTSFAYKGAKSVTLCAE